MAGGEQRLTVGAATFVVDAERGGRVTAFALDGENILSGRDADGDNFGSTFWTSPQSQWGWPPPAEIDRDAYQVGFDGDTLVLAGAVCPPLGVAAEKRFAVDRTRDAITLQYVLHNRGGAVVRLAPWQVTRMRPGGLAFFPSGDGIYAPSTLAVAEAGGATFFAHGAAPLVGHPKLFAGAGAGWMAYAHGRTLFVKTFPLVPREEQAPGEALIEIYAHPAGSYVELESQGPFATIEPGTALHWTVRWYLRRLPAGIEVAVGSASLLDFVAALVAGDA